MLAVLACTPVRTPSACKAALSVCIFATDGRKYDLCRHGVWPGADPLEAPGIAHINALALMHDIYYTSVDLRTRVQAKRGAKLPATKALSHSNADEQLWPRPNDVFIVSYPKVRQLGRRPIV